MNIFYLKNIFYEHSKNEKLNYLQTVKIDSAIFISSNSCCSHMLLHSWLITGFVTRLTCRMSLVEQELPTIPYDWNALPLLCGVRVTRSLVLCVCFVDRCLSFFFWPLCCLSFFELRILITSLVSSKSSWLCLQNYYLSK